ncbi:MAG: HAD-IIB family hydrolase [Pseudomonadota bacterium]
MNIIVFTDLDGTLLDHATYDWSPAKPALHALKGNDIPLVLASSKTAAEIAPLRAELGFEHCPAIVENGAGVLPAGDHVDEHDVPNYRVIRDALADMPNELRAHFRGFGDMDVEDITEITGLSFQDAKRASARAFSEPGLWTGTDEQRAAFTDALKPSGIHARFGGRFLTLSMGGTKAGRMMDVITMLGLSDPLIVALGDAPNDIEMLGAADRAFIIANPHGTPIPPLAGESDGRVTRTSVEGPAGWNAAVLSIVSNPTDQT